MELQIDKGIPVPSSRKASAKIYKYPFHLMEEGDSVFLAKSFAPPSNIRQALNVRLRKDRDLQGRKFTTRTVTEAGVEGIRVWRLA